MILTCEHPCPLEPLDVLFGAEVGCTPTAHAVAPRIPRIAVIGEKSTGEAGPREHRQRGRRIPFACGMLAVLPQCDSAGPRRPRPLSKAELNARRAQRF